MSVPAGDLLSLGSRDAQWPSVSNCPLAPLVTDGLETAPYGPATAPFSLDCISSSPLVSLVQRSIRTQTSTTPAEADRAFEVHNCLASDDSATPGDDLGLALLLTHLDEEELLRHPPMHSIDSGIWSAAGESE